jgi:hypothetical protein
VDADACWWRGAGGDGGSSDTSSHDILKAALAGGNLLVRVCSERLDADEAVGGLDVLNAMLCALSVQLHALLRAQRGDGDDEASPPLPDCWVAVHNLLAVLNELLKRLLPALESAAADDQADLRGLLYELYRTAVESLGLRRHPSLARQQQHCLEESHASASQTLLQLLDAGELHIGASRWCSSCFQAPPLSRTFLPRQ